MSDSILEMHTCQLMPLEIWLVKKVKPFPTGVLRYASSLRGTKQYWFRQRNQLMAMVDTLGLPTLFFTHSAADHHWPELARVICSDADSAL